MARHPKSPSPHLSPRPPSDSDPSVGFDPIEEWLVDFDPAMSGELGAMGLGPAEEEVVAHAPGAPTTCDGIAGQVSEGSVAAKSREFGVKDEHEEVGSLGQADVEMVSGGLGVLLTPGQVLASGGNDDLGVKEDISEGEVKMDSAAARTNVEMNTTVSVEVEGEGGRKEQEGRDEELDSGEESSSSEEEESSEASSTSKEEEERGNKDEESSEASSSSNEEELEAVKPGAAGGRKGSNSIDALLEQGELMLLSDEDDGEPKGHIKAKHEAEVLPPVPKIEIQLEPHHQALPVGTITSIMGERVIVEGSVKHNPLNEGSILWITESRTPLGIVDELFGPVKNPYYLVRYNSESEVPAGISAGTSVSFVAEFADHILNIKELYAKGYDASGDNDEQEDEPEFSDDEKEAEYKKSLRQAKRQTETQHESKKPFDDKRRSQPRGGGSRRDVPPRDRDTPTPGHQPQARFRRSDMATAVAENTACSLGPMGAPTNLLPGPMNSAMPSPVHLADQMGGCFINPAQQFLPQQTNLVWPGGFPPPTHMNMGVEGVVLAANIMQNLLAGANQLQQQFQNPNFSSLPNQMQMPFPQFMPQTGVPGNPTPFGGGPPLMNSPFGPAPQMPMGQGNFGQPARQEHGQRPGFLANSQVANPAQPRGDGGEHSPPQFSSGQFNQGSSSFRGRRPQQRGGRHFSGRGGRHRR